MERVASQGDVLPLVHDLHVVEDHLPASRGVVDSGAISRTKDNATSENTSPQP